MLGEIVFLFVPPLTISEGADIAHGLNYLAIHLALETATARLYLLPPLAFWAGLYVSRNLATLASWAFL